MPIDFGEGGENGALLKAYPKGYESSNPYLTVFLSTFPLPEPIPTVFG
jgi:hypothetical protein